jgi:protocatechuate 3,4-dioxygenase beta subunit
MAKSASSGGLNRRELLAAGLSAAFVAPVRAEQSAAAPVATSCVLTPVTDEGPYYFDPKLIRSDISEHQPGIPLTLDLRVVTVGSCAPIRNARVDVWHSNSHGIYSGYEGQRGVGSAPAQSATGKAFLRGTQLSDKDGRAQFRTIYPSWYYGRTPHIHFKVFLQPREVAVGQLFFTDEISDRVYSSGPDYVPRKRGRDTYNEDDMYLRNGRNGGAFFELAPDGTGYRGSVILGIRAT